MSWRIARRRAGLLLTLLIEHQPRGNMLNLLNAEGWNAACEQHLIRAADHARRRISTLEHLRKGYTWDDREFPQGPEEQDT